MAEKVLAERQVRLEVFGDNVVVREAFSRRRKRLADKRIADRGWRVSLV